MTRHDAGWAHLSHAYGEASDIPYWLSKVSPGREKAWNELWSRLCHQGSVYDASFAALPALLDLARTWSREDRKMPLSLAGAIVAGHDQAPEYEELYRAHANDIAALRELTLDSLCSRQADGETYVALLEALAAFEDIPVWRTELNRLVDREVDALCPACETDLVIELEAVHPRSVASMSGAGARLHALAAAAGQEEVALLLRQLFGEAHCTACGTRFDVADAVAAVVT
jgi:hypothetical protein